MIRGLGSGFILVVEDDSDLREILQIELSDRGFQTHGAENTEEAIVILKQNSISALVTDFELPGQSGLDLIQWVLKNELKIPRIILITGRTDIKKLIPQEVSEKIHILVKPFSMQDLLVRCEVPGSES